MIKFGRFSDAFKPKISLDKWNECEKMYKEKKYNESYCLFFDYLKDPETDNVFHNNEGSLLKFQLLQGSKEIRGYSDGCKVTAMVLIADYEKLGVPVMRRLMELNYTLYYSRFTVRDNKILLKFDSSVLDCSPRKLYYALKEVAVRADKLDDVLIDEFTTLKPFDTHFTNYSESERDIRVKYFRKWINDALSFVSGLKRDEFTGGISYIYLNLVYKIDYLLQPQGQVLNELEKLIWNYFNTKNASVEGLIDELENGLKKVQDIHEEKLNKSFYMVTSTFGISPPSGKEAVENV
ncbi:MAG: YbjN domain-containing protein, partial [Ignavibacteria bacterium]|nr:YbjN domain-containing protein [Ignavibacteria bacterium]